MSFWKWFFAGGLSVLFFFFDGNLPVILAATQGSVQARPQDKISKASAASIDEVVVEAAKADSDSTFLPDVQGARINAGKKSSNIPLDEKPTVTNNNYRQTFSQTSGLLVSEESTPLVSFGYRGLNPDRAQFMQVLQDGIPITADMFGYPEAYYTPPLGSVERIEFLRGGSALLYGPQPGGALNYVTRKPVTDKKIQLSSENVFGSDNYFSTYESLSGMLGPVGYHAYFHEREGDGFRRANSDYEVISSGLKVTLNQTSDSRLTLNYDEYHEEHGEPGGLSLTAAANPTYSQDRNSVTREFDRFTLERYAGSLIYEKDFDDAKFEGKVYGGHYRRWSKRQRGGGFGTVPTGSTANSNDIQEQDFYNLGFEPRLRKDYDLFGETHTLTVGTHNFFSTSPRVEQRGASPVDETGALQKHAVRDLWYLSVFIENLFKWGKLSVVPAVRVENIWQRVEERTNVTKTTAPLADSKDFDSIPLFGLGLVYEIVRGIEAYANFSESYRPKVFTDFVPTGTNQVVNSDLNPGHGVQYDFGLRGKPVSFIHWDIDYFLLYFTDQTGTVGDSIQNVGDLRNQGMEFTLDVDVIGAMDAWKKTEYVKQYGSLSPFTTLTVLDGVFIGGPSDNLRPQYAPKYNFRTGFNYNWRERFKIYFSGLFVGDHFADDAQTANRIVPSYKVWDLTGEVNLVQNAKGLYDLLLFGGINNIFNEMYYARITSGGIDPAAPRNLYGGVKIKLG